MVKFVATEHDIFYPVNELLILSLRRTTQQSWLHVPWPRIYNLHLAREVGDSVECVVFDVGAKPCEASSFFMNVGRPRDRSVGGQGTVPLAYSDSPPRPAVTLKLLLSLKVRSEA